jgi:uncharacterized membrane protein
LVESIVILGIAPMVIAVIWCIYFLVCVREINVRWKRIERTSDELQRKSGSKPVMLYIDDDRGAMVMDLIGISIFAPMVMFALITTDPSDPSSLKNFLGIIAFFAFFSLAPKLIVTSGMRKVFIADSNGIEEVRLKARGFNVVRSIRWQDVTSVDVGYGTSPMIIASSKVETKLLTSLENLEPLFQIMRVAVPRALLSDRAAEFISRLCSTFSLNGESVRMEYSKFMKAFFGILCVVMLLMLWGLYFTNPGELTILSVPGLCLIGLTIFFIVVLMELFLSYSVLSDEGIERHSFRIRKVFIPWNEVESIWVVRGKDGNEFHIKSSEKRIELFIVDGMPQFAKMVVAKLPPEKWARAKTAVMALIKES